MVEQVTICLIMMELTWKQTRFNLRSSFIICTSLAVLAVGIVTIIVIFEGNYDLLHQKRLFWTVLSGV
jgi:hypothetical protein